MYYLAENNWEEAELIMNPHYSSLKDRPEWDGYYTLSEAIEWYSHLIKGDDDNYKSHRLTNIEIDGNESHNIIYDNLGNISFKYDAGSMIYNSTNPYAVRMITDVSDITSFGGSQDVTYTSFDKVKSISQDNKNLHISYGADRQRVRQTLNVGEVSKTKRYFTPRYETISTGGTTKKIHYLTSSTGLFAIFALESNNSGTMSYVIKDHQGSLNATVTGGAVSHYGFDALGRRRDPQTLSYDNATASLDRGYTMHEHHDEFGLINMNGRLYDPLIGRMLSPDIVIQDEQNSQAYNRYSYCFNNPLRFTDPSGYVTTIPPEFEIYYYPELIGSYDAYQDKLTEAGAKNINIHNTDESEGKTVTTLSWTVDGNNFEMRIVDYTLPLMSQSYPHSCLASCLAMQMYRFMGGHGNLCMTTIINNLFSGMTMLQATETALMDSQQGAYYDGLRGGKAIDLFVNYSGTYSNRGIIYANLEKDASYYEGYAFTEMDRRNSAVLFTFTGENYSHTMNVKTATSFKHNNNTLDCYDLLLWDTDFFNDGGLKSFNSYSEKFNIIFGVIPLK